jgi:asparagine synthase (glutamine-hydrolysing)
MSVQFGRWNFSGEPIKQDYLEKVRPVLAPYGPDDEGSYANSNIHILHRAFHTTRESRRETQPYVLSSGAVLNWDGRLDNREELVRSLTDVLTIASTDVAIVGAAYEVWGAACFAKLIGDWALSIWDPRTRSLTLAKDPIGTRHLYYAFDKEQVTWSTILDPLVLFAGKTFELCEEYVAGWFSFFPAAHLTPYVGIHSVPPSSSVVISPGKHTVSKYWDFDPSKRIRYRTDGEYEEHFRAVFGEAVRRRLRSDSPILAELSGGMDSSSIVCMGDHVVSRGLAETPRLDTLSCYNDSEPSWNERPYFTTVEEKRGRIGCHIDVASEADLPIVFESDCFLATPGSSVRQTEAVKQFIVFMESQRNRVLLSGIGGDEVLGGVPTPIPELEDLLARAKFQALGRQLVAWALARRKPLLHLVFETVKNFLPICLVGAGMHKEPAPWLNPDFIRCHKAALQGYEDRVKLLGPLPSFQINVSALDALRRQLASKLPSFNPCYERSYPYVDRDLLVYLFAIPRQQLVRPGERRSLMRRALAGITPEEILRRKRKAYVSRNPLRKIAASCSDIQLIFQSSLQSSYGWIDLGRFSESMEAARQGKVVPIVPLFRTIGVELWLQNLLRAGLLASHDLGTAQSLRYSVAPQRTSINVIETEKRNSALSG